MILEKQIVFYLQEQDDEVAAEDEDDMGVIETYSNYKPMNLPAHKVILTWKWKSPWLWIWDSPQRERSESVSKHETGNAFH